MFTALDILVIRLSLLTIYIFKKITNFEPPILNVYRNPGPWHHVKLWFMYVVLSLRKFAEKRKGNTDDVFKALDGPQQLQDSKRAVDATYFTGGNQSGDYLVTALARRQDKLLDGFFFLKIESSGLGVLESPKLPGTTLQQKEQEEGLVADGIKMVVMEPMRKWRISYDGEMKSTEDASRVYQVKLDGVWISELPFFSYDRDADAKCIAEATAKEIWSRSYFDTLKKIHQVHYEQFGKLNGEITIDGKSYSLDLDILRDRSYGSREWRFFHRYGLHYFVTENGDRFAVLVISMPIAYSLLTVGHVITKQGKVSSLKRCDLQLYQHGENGQPPEDYAFTFETSLEKYTVQVEVVDSPSFYISKDWECKIHERFCRYKVNGVNGWGISEWQYRNISGKRTTIK